MNMKTRPFQIGHIITQPVLKVVTLITCEDPSCGKEFDETTATTITVLGDVEMTICPECRKWWKKHDEFHTEIVTGIRRAALGEVQP